MDPVFQLRDTFLFRVFFCYWQVTIHYHLVDFAVYIEKQVWRTSFTSQEHQGAGSCLPLLCAGGSTSCLLPQILPRLLTSAPPPTAQHPPCLSSPFTLSNLLNCFPASEFKSTHEEQQFGEINMTKFMSFLVQHVVVHAVFYYQLLFSVLIYNLNSNHRCVCREGNVYIDRVWNYFWCQASAEGLWTHSPRIRGATVISRTSGQI